jgi:hypothetical protein
VTLIGAIEGIVVAACFLRYADALKMGDNFASPTSSAALKVASWHISPADLDRMYRRWGVENPQGLDPVRVARDRRILDGLSE